MKIPLELEITEAEIQAAAKEKVIGAVRTYVASRYIEGSINEAIKAQWGETVGPMVQEALRNSPTLKEKIATEIEKKLRAQIATAMKIAKPDAKLL